MNGKSCKASFIGFEREGKVMVDEYIPDHGQANALAVFFGTEERGK